MYSYYYQLIFMIVAFYVNYLFLVPRLFFSRKKTRFFIVITVFGLLLLFVSQYLYDVLQFDQLRPAPDNIADAQVLAPVKRFGLHPKLIDNFFLLLLVLGFSSGMAIIQVLRKNEDRQQEIEKARVDSELAFLKNQVSPHFFFNALNNIYALIAIDSNKAQEAVEKLSVLMRYLIYDSNVENVALEKEFRFIRNYIDLMRQRLNAKVKLDVDIRTPQSEAKIPPLLFIPFVENAFKHGISYREKSYISILLKTEANRLFFECRNSVPSVKEQTSEAGGVGIVNIQKRLELLYGKSALLSINKLKGEYSVTLVLPLDNTTDE